MLIVATWIPSVKYNIKSVGPKIEPWGTPHLMLCEADLTECVWIILCFQDQPWNRRVTKVVEAPYFIKIVWSKVSEAFEKLKKTPPKHTHYHCNIYL